MKKRHVKGEYFKKASLFFDFSRIIHNFALKLTNYEEETIYHHLADGSFRAAKQCRT